VADLTVLFILLQQLEHGNFSIFRQMTPQVGFVF